MLGAGGGGVPDGGDCCPSRQAPTSGGTGALVVQCGVWLCAGSGRRRGGGQEGSFWRRDLEEPLRECDLSWPPGPAGFQRWRTHTCETILVPCGCVSVKTENSDRFRY